MHSGGRAKVVETPVRLTVAIGRISCPLAVVVSQLAGRADVGVLLPVGAAMMWVNCRLAIAPPPAP